MLKTVQLLPTARDSSFQRAAVEGCLSPDSGTFCRRWVCSRWENTTGCHLYPDFAAAEGYLTTHGYILQEVVALGRSVWGVEELAQRAGRHASPSQFHAMLDAAPQLPKPTVLLDARNIYESRIGTFQAVRPKI